MAPSLRAYASAAGTALSQPVTIPASTQGGDILVLFVMSGATPTNPAGWDRLDSQLGTGMAGRIFVRKAAGTVGATSTDAGTVVTCAVASSSPTQVYLAVIQDAVGVRLRGSFRSSTLNMTAPQTHPQSTALVVSAGAVRVATPTALSITSPSTLVDAQSSDAAIAGALVTRTGPITVTSTFSATPSASPGSGSYFGSVVAWDSTSDSAWDRDFATPPGAAAASSSSVRTTGGLFEVSAPAAVKALWVYIANVSQAGQTLTAAVWGSTGASVPLVTATIVAPAKVGWLRIPLTTWPWINAATPFLASVSWSGQISSLGAGPVHSYPLTYNRLTLSAGRTSTSATVPVNPATNQTTNDYYVDIEITTATEVEVVGGGGPIAGSTPLLATVIGGGEVTSRVPLVTDVSGGGGIETIAWQTDFPAEDVPDIDPVDFIDPDVYEEPPVLQSTLDMPDPTTIVDGVPVDWEPT